MSNISKNTVWGNWVILFEDSLCKVKRITVKPGHRLSYQTHKLREEYWTIIHGQPIINLNGTLTEHKPGDYIHIPQGAAHRIGNSSDQDVIFIEIQRGSYFGEDDIIRLEDDYGRS